MRFEIPNRFVHLRRRIVRYARWNLGDVHLVDPRTDTLLTPIYPLDKARNADGRRARRAPTLTTTPATSQTPRQMAPLLRKLLADYAATGIPPAYLPKRDPDEPYQETNP